MTEHEVVRVIQPKPRGWFSRLVWRWVRYDLPKDGDIRLTIVPPSGKTLYLGATWVEWPIEIGVTDKIPDDGLATSATGPHHESSN